MAEDMEKLVELLGDEELKFILNTRSVDAEKFYDLQEIWDVLELATISNPTLCHYSIEIPAGYSGAATISLPEGVVCPQRVFEVWSERPKYTKYGWRIDTKDPKGEAVPKHHMTPNVTDYTERNHWGRYWVKHEFLYYMFENTHDTDSIVHRPTAWAQFVDEDAWDEYLKPFIWAKVREIQSRGRWLGTGEKEIPTKPLTTATVSRTEFPEADPTYRCLECGSVLEVDFAEKSLSFLDQLANEGSGRAQYGDPHPDCPLLSPTEENLERALDEGKIEEV